MIQQARVWKMTAALALALLPAAAAARAERLSVPLSDPARPATLKVSLIAGEVRVEGYAGKEVVMETDDAGADTAGMRKLGGGPSTGDERETEEERAKARGMRRLPNRSMGLAVEEEKNVVRVVADSSRTPTDLRVQVPAASTVSITTVSGDITIAGLGGEMELQSTSGSIEVRDAVATVIASTVNGDVKVVFARLAASRPMSFSSFNGDVDVTLPASAAADLRMSSENGDIYTDFDFTVSARPPAVSEESHGGRRRIALSKEMHGTIGAGGPEILFKTFNGNVYIRKAK